MPVNYTLEIDGRSGSAVINSVGSGSSDGAITSPTITTDAKDTATKTIAKIETALIEKYIEGSVQIIPTHKVRKGMILYLSNLGAMFEGKYYVKRVAMSMSVDGFSVTLDVIRISDKIEKVSSTRIEKIALITPVVSSSPTYKTITIAYGDTLTKLARLYKSTVQELASINGIKNPDLIYAGKTLKVPVR